MHIVTSQPGRPSSRAREIELEGLAEAARRAVLAAIHIDGTPSDSPLHLLREAVNEGIHQAVRHLADRPTPMAVLADALRVRQDSACQLRDGRRNVTSNLSTTPWAGELLAVTAAARVAVVATADDALSDPGPDYPLRLVRDAAGKGVRRAVLAATKQPIAVAVIADALCITLGRVRQLRDGTN